MWRNMSIKPDFPQKRQDVAYQQMLQSFINREEGEKIHHFPHYIVLKFLNISDKHGKNDYYYYTLITNNLYLNTLFQFIQNI